MARKNATVFRYRGKWRVEYSDLFGRTRTKTANTKLEAQQLAAELRAQASQGLTEPVGHELPTLAQWLESYLESRAAELKPNTVWG
jgi:integrase